MGLFVETQVPLFLTDLEDAKRALLESSMTQPIPETPLEDVFALYRSTRDLLKMMELYAPKYVYYPS